MMYWTKQNTNWKQEMGKKGLRWHDSWSQNAKGAEEAVESWLAKPAQVEACRSDHVWPPPSQPSQVLSATIV